MGEILSFGSSSKFKTDLGGNMRIIIVGGIAAGMSAAAKLRRTDRDAEIVVYEKSPHISFGACGLPYYVGGNFDNIDRMLVRTPEKVRETGIDVKVEHEVLSLDVQNKTIKVKDLQSGEIFSDKYDITKHRRYKELSDFNRKNEFDIEKYLEHKLVISRDTAFEMHEYEITKEDIAAIEAEEGERYVD